MRTAFRAGMLALLCAVALAGCATQNDAINEAAAVRLSYTDPLSRQLAERSHEKLVEGKRDYALGPGDLLEISIFEWELSEETKTARFRVSETGVISLPVVGDIEVGKRTVMEVRRKIEDRLREGGYIMQPRVSVNIVEFRSKRVSVVGAVHHPGVYVLRENVSTLLEVLSLAGGLKDEAGYRLRVLRARPEDSPEPTGGPEAAGEDEAATVTLSPQPPPSGVQMAELADEREVVTIDLYELLELGDMSLNMVLQDGNVVHVPPAERFSVIGFVRKPGSFPLRRPTTVLEAVAHAEGLKDREASPRRSMLIRRIGDEKTRIPIDLAQVSAGRKPNIYVMPDDILEVPQTSGKRVFLETLDALKGFFTFTYRVN